MSDNDQHKAEYIIDKEQHLGTLTSTQIFSGINYFIAYGKNVIRNSTQHLILLYFSSGVGYPTNIFYSTIPFISRTEGKTF